MSSSKTPPSGANQPVGGLPPDGLPPEALPPGPLPEGLAGEPPMPGAGSGKIRMKTMPRMNARPYIKRAFKLLGGHKAMVALSLFLSLVMFLLPFVAAAAFGPLIKLFGDVAKTGNWNQVWSVTGSFYDKTAQTGDAGWFSFVTDWLATPLSFTTIFVIWTFAIVFRNVLDILHAWVNAYLEQRLLN